MSRETPRTMWTEEQRASALTIYVQQGAAAASRLTGIPSGTIKSWANRTPGLQPLREETRRDLTQAAVEERTRQASLSWAERKVGLIDQLGGIAEALLDCAADMIEDERPREAKEALVGAAIAIDKCQLLSGGATGRQEVEVPQLIRDQLLEAGRERVLELLPPSREKDKPRKALGT